MKPSHTPRYTPYWGLLGVRCYGEFAVDQFTSSIRQAITQGNWHAALYVSLTMPDICARLESENERTSSTKFIAWFDRYLAQRYKSELGHSEEHVFLSGSDCYALRCAMLHEGVSDISSQRLQETLSRFHFSVVGSHCNQFDSVLQLDVPTFCNDVCNAVDQWLGDFKVLHADKLYRLNTLLRVHVGTHEIAPGVVFQGSGT